MPEMKTLTVNGVTYDLRDTTKAPGGFGLGTHSSYFDFNNVDSITKNGWYCFATSGITLAGHYFGQGIMEVCCYDENAVRQVIYPAGNLSMEIVRQRSGGIWGEWVNCSPSAFAPAGYGLGQTAISVTDFDTAYDTGWYHGTTTTANRPFGYSVVHTINDNGDRRVQIGYDVAPFASSYYSAHVSATRRYSDGAWQPWEYINPPMYVGVEYRTTERWNGKPVYVRAINMGAMPNKESFLTFMSTNAWIIQIIDSWAFRTHTAAAGYKESLPLPNNNVANSTHYDFYIESDSGYYWIVETEKDLSAWEWTLVIKYWKPAD